MIKAHDKNIINQSSSGGVFSLLADKIIKEGGAVFGAVYNFEKERLEHTSSAIVEVDLLRKSKYIESYTGNIYKEVENILRTGKKVLFVGTPCQISGLNKYLTVKKTDRSQLLLVRFVCHGVPSNKFFTEYKHYEENKYGGKMISFDFRPKDKGWGYSCWKMMFDNNTTIFGPYNFFYYYTSFQKNTLLRRCCYDCDRITDNNIADLTIYVDADQNIRLNRRIVRDINERGRTKESVLKQFKKTVAPMHNIYIEPTKNNANHIFINNQNDGLNQKQVEVVVNKIKNLSI